MANNLEPSYPRIAIAAPTLNGNEKRYVLECLETTWISSIGRFITEFFNPNLVPVLGLYGAVLGSLVSIACISLPLNLRAMSHEAGGSLAAFLR